MYFATPGTIEYILGKAGFYRPSRGRSGPGPPGAEPTERLGEFFPGRVVPPEATLVPILERIIDFCDRLGAVDRGRDKSAVHAALLGLGLTHKHGAIGQLVAELREATEAAARDVANRPPLGR